MWRARGGGKGLEPISKFRSGYPGKVTRKIRVSHQLNRFDSRSPVFPRFCRIFAGMTVAERRKKLGFSERGGFRRGKLIGRVRIRRLSKLKADRGDPAKKTGCATTTMSDNLFFSCVLINIARQHPGDNGERRESVPGKSNGERARQKDYFSLLPKASPMSRTSHLFHRGPQPFPSAEIFAHRLPQVGDLANVFLSFNN